MDNEKFKKLLDGFKIKEDFIKYINYLKNHNKERALALQEEINKRAETKLENMSSMTIDFPGFTVTIGLAQSNKNDVLNLARFHIDTI